MRNFIGYNVMRYSVRHISVLH